MSEKCVVNGCDFEVDRDSEEWYEQLEQHVRWIHIPEMNFGPTPVPSLFALLATGLIRPDEFARLLHDIIEQEMEAIGPPTPERLRRGERLYRVGTVAYIAAFALLVASNFFGHTGTRLIIMVLGEVAVVALYWTFQRMLSLAIRPVGEIGDVRVELYPDTGEG